MPRPQSHMGGMEVMVPPCVNTLLESTLAEGRDFLTLFWKTSHG